MGKKEKDILRKQMRGVRDAVSEENRRRWSKEIEMCICRSRWWRDSEILLSYASFGSEVETDSLNRRALEENKILYLPRTYEREGRMEFYRVTSFDELTRGYRGIREPEESVPFPETGPGQTLKEGSTVLMLMPGVAYDGRRNRIGYGGGYYDCYLERYGTYIDTKVMLAFSCQRVDEIPAEELDVSPDYVIHEEE